MAGGLKKGQTNNPNGRPKGRPNKTTTDFKQAVNNLIEYATPQMVGWLSQVAQEDPARAMELIAKLGEFAHPKLARTTVVGEKGSEPVQVTVNYPKTDA